MLKAEFEQYLIKQGYSVITPSGNPSTVYDYIKRLDKVIEWEHLFKSSMFDVMETQALTEDDVQIELSSLPNYGTYANSNKTVRLNAYDKYTDYDKYIDEYEEIYKNKVHTFYGFGLNISVSDDPIINIIPKQLFVARGTYSYIGKEYGFYVKTVQDYSVIGGRVDYYNEIPSESEGGNIKESIMYHTEFTKDPIFIVHMIEVY